jgi:uncharacterized protein YukE
MATVRGTFDLNSRPASTALRRLREEGSRTDLTMRRLGDRMDRIGTVRQVERLRAYERGLARLDRQAATTLGTLTLLDARMEALGQRTVRPSVDISGVESALARVELLHSRLNSLGREVATPRVSVGGGFSGTPAIGGGGGAFGGPGGFGGANGRFRLPFVGSIGAGGAAAMFGLGLPAARGLIGGAGALGATLGMGAAGAGAVGIAGGGVLTSAIGSIASVAVPAASGISAASDALESFRETVQETGRNSAESRAAMRALNAELAQAPQGTRQFLRARDRLSRTWKRETAPAQGRFTQLGTLGANTLTNMAPQLGAEANQFFGAALPAGRDLSRFMQNRNTSQFIDIAGDMASGNLDEFERTVENVAGTMMNLTVAARPFFHEAMVWMEQWTQTWQGGTHNVRETRKDIGEMVDHFRSFARLTGASWDLLKALLGPARGPGQSMVDDLTQQFREWEAWADRNPRKLRQFFREGVEDTKAIANALGDVVGWLERMGELLRPTLQILEQMASILNTLGPGAIPAFMATRGALRGVPMGMPGRGGVPGTAGPAAGPGGVIPLAAGTAGAAAGAGAAAARAGAYGGTVRGAYTHMTRMGASRLTAARAALMGYGGVTGAGMAAAGMGAGAAGARAGGALMAGARAYAPFAIGFGALDAATFDGGVANRAGAFLNTLTLGLSPRPETSAEITQNVLAETQGMIGKTAATGMSARAQRNALARLVAARSDSNRVLGVAGMVGGLRGPEGRASLIEGADPMAVPSLLAFRREALARRSALVNARGTAPVQDFAQAYSIRARSGSAEAALGETASGMTRELGRLKGESRDVFADASLQWLKDLRKANPKLKAETRAMARAIEDTLQGMGEKVKMIHGRIYDVSASQWEGIRQKMTSEAEKARQETMREFTTLQRQAVGVLQSMGFSGADARKIVSGLEEGGSAKRSAQIDMRSGPTGAGQALSTSAENQWAGSGDPPKNAHGGRIRGGHMMGNQDHVQLPDGSLGAGGELVVNRHTERRVDRFLSMMGTSLGQEVSGEQRPHSGPMYALSPTDLRGLRAAMAQGVPAARGKRQIDSRGRRGAGAGMVGASVGSSKGITNIVELGHALEAQGYAVGEHPAFGGVQGGHSANSYHYRGMALDVNADSMAGGEKANLDRLYAQLKGDPGIVELLWQVADHYDHLHLAMSSGGAVSLAGRAGAVSGEMTAQQMRPLRASRTKTSGVAGALEGAGKAAIAKAMTERINKKIGGMAVGTALGGSYSGGIMTAEQVARLAESVGLPGITFAQIAKGESGFNPAAIGHDPGGTRGLGLWQITTGYNTDIIKALGGEEAMLNPQTNARAAKMIYERQGIGAWYGTRYMTDPNAHYQGGNLNFARGGRMARWAGWHGRGGSGVVDGPTLLGAGEAGPEEVHISPLSRRKNRAGARPGGSGPVSVTVNFGDVHVKNQSDVNALADKVGKVVAERVRGALVGSGTTSEDVL